MIKLQNTADFSLRFNKNALVLANKYELSRFGKETLQSGGYIYLDYQRISEHNFFAIEPYAQIHLNEARGLDRKYAGGLNFRLRLVANKNSGFFAGIGPFYEHEQWDFRGVADDNLPDDVTVDDIAIRKGMRYGAFLSYDQQVGNFLTLAVSAYYQSAYTLDYEQARLASSFRLTYKFTRYLGITALYQNIYDPEPVVPIDRLFHNATLSLSVNI